jgi:hypothetical protein
MNSIILKTFAAASLVAAAQAEVHVLGAVWKERGLSAPAGTIDPNPGTVASTRGYLIFDESILTAAPNPGTLIQYRDVRAGGVIQRTFTVNSFFRAFNGDIIAGDSGGRRIYGQIHAPNTIANVAGAVMPYSGSPNSDGYPVKLRLDDTVFQVGTASSLTGPQIVDLGATLARSVISGSASSIKVEATTIASATDELTDRLEKSGFTRAAGVPVITTDLPATLALQDGQQQILSVVVADAFPTPTYQWFKDNVAILAANGGTSPTYTVTGGATSATNGSGVYKVEVSTSAGTDVSGNLTVSGVTTTFATNLPATLTITGSASSVLGVTLNPVPITTPTYQWQKGGVDISAANGGTGATLTVVGGQAATGVGNYTVKVTTSTGTITSATCQVSVNNVPLSFTTNLPAALAVPNGSTAVLAPVVVANPLPVIASYRWSKAPLGSGVFTNVADANGGNQPTLTVTSNVADPTGPGIYRLTVTNAATPTPATAVTVNCTVTLAP